MFHSPIPSIIIMSELTAYHFETSDRCPVDLITAAINKNIEKDYAARKELINSAGGEGRVEKGEILKCVEHEGTVLKKTHCHWVYTIGSLCSNFNRPIRAVYPLSKGDYTNKAIKDNEHLDNVLAYLERRECENVQEPVATPGDIDGIQGDHMSDMVKGWCDCYECNAIFVEQPSCFNPLDYTRNPYAFTIQDAINYISQGPDLFCNEIISDSENDDDMDFIDSLPTTTYEQYMWDQQQDPYKHVIQFLLSDSDTDNDK